MVRMMADNLTANYLLFLNNPRKMLYFCVIDFTAITQNNVAKLHCLRLFPKVMSAKRYSAVGSLVFTDKFVALSGFFQVACSVDYHKISTSFGLTVTTTTGAYSTAIVLSALRTAG